MSLQPWGAVTSYTVRRGTAVSSKQCCCSRSLGMRHKSDLLCTRLWKNDFQAAGGHLLSSRHQNDKRPPARYNERSLISPSLLLSNCGRYRPSTATHVCGRVQVSKELAPLIWAPRPISDLSELSNDSNSRQCDPTKKWGWTAK